MKVWVWIVYYLGEMKYLGVDFGLRRVGLAISEGELASPWKTVEVDKLSGEAANFDKVVIGVPEGKTGKVVLKVVKSLRRIGVDVIEADETLSSQKAITQMIELGIPKEKRKVNDAHSAAIILQNYLDEQT